MPFQLSLFSPAPTGITVNDLARSMRVRRADVHVWGDVDVAEAACDPAFHLVFLRTGRFPKSILALVVFDETVRDALRTALRQHETTLTASRRRRDATGINHDHGIAGRA